MPDDRTEQAFQIHDDSPARFRANHREDSFAGASGVLFEQAMAQTRMAICLCDPTQADIPIIFSNRAFRKLTGYDEGEILGRNCRFLQGPETDPAAVAKIRAALTAQEVVVVELVNYRKDGSRFWNALHLGPIYDDAGGLLYYFGSQWDVSEVRAARSEEQHAREMARELSHRMKNMFSVIGGIVNITGRSRGIEAEAREINERIQALGRAYETTLDDSSRGTVEIGQSIRAVVAPYDPAGNRIRLLGNGLRTNFGAVSVLGLTLHELATNALKYGALSGDEGTVDIDWQSDRLERDPTFRIDWIERGGPAVNIDEMRPITGTGTEIVDRLLRMSGGTIERGWDPRGLQVTVRLPLQVDRA
ncbi:PAS domain-containing protein [Novosphingobium lentum]|uniref:PAS domain-containing protein n=1 Tax=Novosphingobium lentum TaxID=145287 RepID=UPI000AE11455|nr:PAS domain-containing protein [Novosphingobium lentum]